MRAGRRPHGKQEEYDMWYDRAVVYQIYPLGLCGAPLVNSGDAAQA